METAHEDTQVFRRKIQQRLLEQYGASGESVSVQTRAMPGKTGDPDGRPIEKQSPFSLQNFLLLIAAGAAFYFSNFHTVVMYDQRIYRTWFWIGTFGVTVHVCICCFLVFYCSFFKKMNSDEWELIYPKAIPVATAAIAIGIICLSIALWPVWGLLTPLIIGSLVMGIVVLVAMVG